MIYHGEGREAKGFNPDFDLLLHCIRGPRLYPGSSWKTESL